MDVERPVESLQRRDEEDEPAVLRKDRREVAKRPAVVLDVLEDVQADDRVDLLRFELLAVGRGERESGTRRSSRSSGPRTWPSARGRSGPRRRRRRRARGRRRSASGSRRPSRPRGSASRARRRTGRGARRCRARASPSSGASSPPTSPRGASQRKYFRIDPDGLEGVLQADLLPFLVRPAVVGDRDLEDPRAHPGDLARDLGLDPEPLRLQVEPVDDVAAS